MSKFYMRAFENKKYNYYRITENLGEYVPKGAIFVHDTDDDSCGVEGCLKLCFSEDGDCYMGEVTGLFSGTVIFHGVYVKSRLFELVEDNRAIKLKTLINELQLNLERASAELKEISKSK